MTIPKLKELKAEVQKCNTPAQYDSGFVEIWNEIVGGRQLQELSVDEINLLVMLVDIAIDYFDSAEWEQRWKQLMSV